MLRDIQPRLPGKLAAAVAAGAAAIVLGGLAALAATSYSQGFETDTVDWVGATRVSTGTNGIASADGSYHAEVDDAFTQFGGYESTFPSGGYTTGIDIYLDTTWAAANPDVRFDWDVASNYSDGSFLQDYVFNVGTTPATYLGTPGFVVNASTNSGRGNSFPSNPCPSPSTPPNSCRAPIYITASGWYTFVHHFFDDGGHLAVAMSILDSSGTSVAAWTIAATQTSAAHCVAPACTLYVSPVPIGDAGGHRYGWFAQQELPILAIDNVNLVSISEPGDKDDCKKGGWESLTRADGSTFKNQGDCIQYVNTGK